MIYFSISQRSMMDRKLKVAVVFVFDTFRFEVWLSASNRTVLTKYHKILKELGWNIYTITPLGTWMDSILTHTIMEHPNFSDLDKLTEQIEKSLLDFINKVEEFFVSHNI